MLIPQNINFHFHYHCTFCYDYCAVNKNKSDAEILECVTQKSTDYKNNSYWWYCYEIKHHRQHLQDQWDNIQRLLFNPEG